MYPPRETSTVGKVSHSYWGALNMPATSAAFSSLVRSFRSASTAPDNSRLTPPCPADVIERAALIEASAVERTAADLAALTMFGFAGWPDLAAAHAAVILAEINRLPPPCDRVGARLARGTERLLNGPHWCAIVAAGWPLSDVFGCDEWQPLERIELMGLAVRAAVHAAPGRRLERITDAGAEFREPDGRLVLYRRPSLATDVRGVVPWWRSPAIVNREAA
jgi:hypothetical protein